ncbi:hypothetical protein HY224_01405 [Candidatus Uhrbacteria bacterium]|nr:hypothetical protein [Candidatus Uhrbacteria bacterium]
MSAVLTDPSGSRNFKLIRQELDFYRKLGVPIPENAFVERHKTRWNKRNPKQLWSRQCDKCSNQIETTFDPALGDKVYCKECFMKEVV